MVRLLALLRRHIPAALAATLVALIVGLAAETLAQATGGSFGGGDWGGGGSSGGGGGGYGGGGSSHDDDSGFILFQLVYLAFRIHPLFGLVVLVIGVGIFIARAASRNSGGGGQPSSWGSSGGASPQPFVMTPAAPQPGSRAWMNADVTQVRIALDVAARPAIEEALNAMMRSVDVRTRHGLLLVVHRVAGLLRQHERAWRLAGETNYHPMSPPQASGVFSQLAAAGRAKASAPTSASGDPAGVFFITLLVAAKREIVDFHAHRPEQIRMVLDDLARLGEHDLVAAEVYWLPLQQGTGMTVDEVRRMHPDMKHVEHGGSGGGGAPNLAAAFAPGGATFCPFCGKQRLGTGPRCEHCGAEPGGAPIVQRG